MQARAAQRPRPQRVSRPVSRRVRRCRRVGGGTTVLRLSPMRPNSLAAALVLTSAQPLPLATSDPAKILSPGPCLAIGNDSPVRRDSSSHRPTASRRVASATTRSPSSRRKQSPGRTSSAASSSSWPSRRTWARGAESRASSARALWLRCCCSPSSSTIPATNPSRISPSIGSPISP